jgi:hypothetical protein
VTKDYSISPRKRADSIKPSVQRSERWVSVSDERQAHESGRQWACFRWQKYQPRAAAHFMGLGFNVAAIPSVPLRSTLGFMLAARSAGSMHTLHIAHTFISGLIKQEAHKSVDSQPLKALGCVRRPSLHRLSRRIQ